ncbi:MAG: diguanylate cyclase [Acidobacteria bacterium]|nr:diguanylate cyclase [Acidobacteriota bacterium]
MSALAWLARRRHVLANLSFRQQLVATAFFSLLLFFGGLVLFAHTTNRLLATLHRSHRLEETLAAARSLRRLPASLEMNLAAYLSSGRPEFLRAYQLTLHAQQDETERITTLLADAPEARSRFEEALAQAERWHTDFALRALEQHRTGRPAQTWLASPAAHAQLGRFYAELELFIDFEQQQLENLRAAAEAAVRRMIYLAFFLAVIGVLGSWWWTNWLSRSVSRPLTDLLRASERLAAGNPVPMTQLDPRPEMVRLAESFNRLASGLQQMQAEAEALEGFIEELHRCQNAAEMHRAFFEAVGARAQPERAWLLAADPSASLLELSASLPPTPAPATSVMAYPSACPAVRGGKAFGVEDTARQSVCQCELNVPQDAGSYFCLPLESSAGLLGLVSLTGPAQHWTPERRRYVARCTDHLARHLAAEHRLAQAQKQAMLDDLTQLYNRRFTEEYLQKLLALSRRTRRPFSLLLFDLDHFKEFNDRFGHPAGDRLLHALPPPCSTPSAAAPSSPAGAERSSWPSCPRWNCTALRSSPNACAPR